ncbi:MAG: alpha/beta fold hydrolase [Propionibacteriales bacterium]|nr:alpha/beta fold hydrolase [Propionibacteriales bacterium]
MSTPPFLELPPGVEKTVVATSRGDLAALVATPDSGRRRGTAVLVPGWTGSKEDFIGVLPLLADAGWRAVGYDQRGQFESVADPADDFSLEGFAADAATLMRAVSDGDPVHLVGHSFGGMVAQRTALVAGGGLPASLTLLCSGPAGFEDPTACALLRAMDDALRTTDIEAVYDAKRQHDLANGADDAPPEIERFLRRRFVSNSPHSLAAITSHLVTAEDRIDELAALNLPVHVAYGESDDRWPIDTQRRMAERLGVRPIEIPGTAHSPAAEDPPRVAVLMDELFATSGAGAPAG